jgi:hypothetical protein
VKINSADAAGVQNFYAWGPNDQLVTSDATLDLSKTSVSGFTIASTNTSGTTFTVHDVGTAFQIAGGPGQDAIVASGFNFTADQRNAIFATASVEKIVDASGTYTKPPPNPNTFTATIDWGDGTSSSGTAVIAWHLPGCRLPHLYDRGDR